MAKFGRQSFDQNNFSSMTLLHAHTQYIHIVYAKYQITSVKAVVQVDFPVYVLSKCKQNKSKQEKMANFTKLSFCQKIIFRIMQMFNVSKLCRQYILVSNCFSKSCGTSWFHCICTIINAQVIQMAKFGRKARAKGWTSAILRIDLLYLQL